MYVTTNILFRIVKIITPFGSGSGTIIELSGQDFVLTATHVTEGVHAGQEIALEGHEWKSSFIIKSKHSRGDICLISFGGKFNRDSFPILLGSKSAILSMDVFLMGFPEGRSIYLDVGDKIKKERNMFPYIRKGIISAIGNNELIVDCIIQKGFSGGPLFFMDGHNKTVPRIIGIISSGLTFEGDNTVFDDRLATTIRSGFTSCISVDLALELAEDELGINSKLISES